ncbi:MAG TPA: LLM class flavin-dependent oxidoreductase [Gammaproteobacteria bacterium]|nr:LLM class flavin-dependent oxidoreductase [Gammaproteobacteria bacterium]
MKKTCYLFGSKSLLIQCFQSLQSNSFDVKAVVSDDASIIKWASSLGLTVIGVAEQFRLLELGSVDYIFSITHLKIIPGNILKLANINAINFHDGLLPGYAGLNVTTWAIYHQKKNHGVSWHEMTAEVDSGGVLKQSDFEIEPTETAFTLNAKCYEAALSSFNELLEDISNNTVVSISQQAEKSVFFGACQRIPGMAVLNWQYDAEILLSTIRALHFGPYLNPISLPKLLLKDSVFYVHEAEKIDAQPGRPGQVMSKKYGLDISAKNAVIRLKNIVDEQGKIISVTDLLADERIKEGDILQHLDEAQVAELTQIDESICRCESGWLKKLQSFKSLVPVMAGIPGDERIVDQLHESSVQSIAALSGKSAETALSSLVLFFSRISCQSSFSLYYNLQQKSDFKSLLIERCIPVAFEIEFSESVSDLISLTESQLRQLRSEKPYCKDLLLRHPELDFSSAEKTLVISEMSCDSSVDLKAEADKFSEDMDLFVGINSQTSELVWRYSKQKYSTEKISRLQVIFSVFMDNIVDNPEVSLADTSMLSAADYDKIIHQWNKTESEFDQSICVHKLFEKQVENTPSATALSFSGIELSYETLNQRSNQLAHYLIKNNIKADQLVGVLLDRSVNMIVAMLGILKAGGAYLPLDPSYPKDRIQYMLEDAQVVSVITQREHAAYADDLSIKRFLIDEESLNDFPQHNPGAESSVQVNSTNLVYVIYTSGSTGKPKGVMVEHRNVVSFFHAMDNVVTGPEDVSHGVWLAVTSISFDISVLEIFWTLARGFELALYSDVQSQSVSKSVTAYPDQEMEFSLFYWNVADDESEYDDDAYRLLLESAKYGDKNNFRAVWTPERHFHAFGGLYPNPSVSSAALAAITENIHIRAGSCVIPLHHPVRVAEDWSMIDNLSGGRAGIAIASGWQPDDFVIMPQNYADARHLMFESLETVRKLWRGDTVEFPGHDGKNVQLRTLPRPVQKELPVWVTTAGNPETFKNAGEVGANILTHLLGQTVEDVSKNIKIYRKAYNDAGHEGGGHVTLLLHTLVGESDEEVKELARKPMKKYLKSAMFLVKAAAWNFPTFKKLSEETGQTLDEFFENISDEDMDGILEFAFHRYYETSGLFGTPDHCLEMVDRLKEIGVNEIGCLIDYGLDTDNVLGHLPALNNLRKKGIKQVSHENAHESNAKKLSISEIIKTRQVTHLQCTPSMASMLLADNETVEQLSAIKHLMVGGEALTLSLAKRLIGSIQGKLTNMYGPTETTIWSATQDIEEPLISINIGRPIANTQVYVLDQFKQPVPVNMPGELYIAGAGVVRGYHRRGDLTSQRFINNPFVSAQPGASQLMYRTGDIVQYNDDGVLECLGRVDQQVKIRGYRIELGEIEAALTANDSVSDAVVILREDKINDRRLVAYLITESGKTSDSLSLKNELKKTLPEFMVPDVYVELERFPLTSNGKIDRNAFPMPEKKQKKISAVVYAPAENRLQEIIVSTWQSVLNLDEISLDDNFFDIGGHSLLVVEVLSQLREKLQRPVKMLDMFRFPTIRQFSESLSDQSDKSEQLSEIEDRAAARKNARASTMNRRRARTGQGKK